MLNGGNRIRILCRLTEDQHASALLTMSIGTLKYKAPSLFRHASLLFGVTPTKNHRHSRSNGLHNFGLAISTLSSSSPHISDQFCGLTTLRRAIQRGVDRDIVTPAVEALAELIVEASVAITHYGRAIGFGGSVEMSVGAIPLCVRTSWHPRQFAGSSPPTVCIKALPIMYSPCRSPTRSHTGQANDPNSKRRTRYC